MAIIGKSEDDTYFTLANLPDAFARGSAMVIASSRRLLKSFIKEAFKVAAKTGVLVVPITLMGTGKIMPTGSEGILNHGDVRVIIHKPIYGSKADVLRDEARNKIAESMNLLS